VIYLTSWKIPLYKIKWDENDVNEVEKIIRRGMFWTGGSTVRDFENDIAKFVGREFALAFNSGTSALSTAIQMMQIGKGDEVIVPSFTFISTCNAVLHANAIPVFAEIEDLSYGLDPADVEKRITDKTKAIIPVHYAGAPCKIDEIKRIADDNNLYVIEDAAESLGSFHNSKAVGSVGTTAMFSFCGNKVMTTGEGGMLVLDDPELFEKFRLFRSHGRVDNGDYFSSNLSFDYLSPGHNFRMSDIIAALGRSQFAKLPSFIRSRQALAKLYDSLLQEIPVVTPQVLPNSSHMYQMYTVRFENNATREKVKSHLSEKGIMSKIFFDCVHKTSLYSKIVSPKDRKLPLTEKIASTVLTLPIYPDMSEEEVGLVCSEIDDAIR
jgi:perosamine synthetase